LKKKKTIGGRRVDLSWDLAEAYLNDQEAYDSHGLRAYKNIRFEWIPIHLIVPTEEVDTSDTSDNTIRDWTRLWYQKVSPIPPLVCHRKRDGCYHLMNGHHRFEGARKAGIWQVPVLSHGGYTERNSFEAKRVYGNVKHTRDAGVVGLYIAEKIWKKRPPSY